MPSIFMCLRSICCCEDLLHSAKAERSQAIEHQQPPSKLASIDMFITRLPKIAEARSDKHTHTQRQTDTCVHVDVGVDTCLPLCVCVCAYITVCIYTYKNILHTDVPSFWLFP